MTAAETRQADLLPPELMARIDETITHYPVSRRSASVPLLHLWQNHFGYIDDSGVDWIARKLDLEPINILELVTFYPWFRQTAPGKTTIRVCRTLSCAMAGASDVREKLLQAAGALDLPDHGHGVTSPDGRYTIEFVECLASCGTAPVALVDDQLVERLKPSDAARILRDADRTYRKTLRSPHPAEKRMILKNIGREDYDTSLDCYCRHGGYESLKKALKMKPEEIVAEVKASNLRGRGGAGFPVGVKWSFIKRDDGKPHYLVVNGDESEPGTFKDRYIVHEDPHQLLEGMMIAAWALNVHLSYIYIRCEFPEAARIMEKAIAEAKAAGFIGKDVCGSGFDCDIFVHQGAGAYICGEETSLLESLEGKRPYPRIKPPFFPAVFGLYNCPTIVNNVESLCHVKHIIAMGGAAFAKLGSPGDGGTRRASRVRIVTSDYLDVTDPDALRLLILLQELGAQVRVFETKGSSFHMKAYLFAHFSGDHHLHGTAFIGSSNISRQALTDGLEWNYRVDYPADDGFLEARDRFDEVFKHGQTVLLTDAWVDAYEARRVVPLRAVAPF